MSNELTKTQNQEKELLKVVADTLYPGAKISSVEMVLSYCKATKIDPMLKPVHIVPMSVKNAETGQYAFRDTVMPSIGFYRICAERSGKYAGISEPEFGPDVKETLSGVTVTYPKWCKITVYKIIDGTKCSFTAKEFWLENYATKKHDSSAPNAMWKKRSYGQLAKCTEAQALRKAFPELITSQPTFEEMEGKDLMGQKPKNVSAAPSKVYESKADEIMESMDEAVIVEEAPAKESLICRMVDRIKDLGGDDADICATANVESIFDLDEANDDHMEALKKLGKRLKDMGQ